jgi:enterochelin esterase-like enzyme
VQTLLVLAAVLAPSADAKTNVAGPEKKNGIDTYVVTSDYQQKPVNLHVLLPDRFDRDKKYRVLYILPAWDPSPEGIQEAKKLGLHNRHDLICVGPDFSSMPWYVDHPEKKNIRFDSYLPDVVVPFIDRTYPTLANPEGRLLVGFSKSGLGAVSLLLRHPEVFGRAGAWDAPLIMDNRPEFYGPKEYYLANYYLPTLLKKQADSFKDRPARIAVIGYSIPAFQKGNEDFHELLNKQGISHYFNNSVKRGHDWRSGWLAPLVEVLTADDMTKATPDWSVKDPGK